MLNLVVLFVASLIPIMQVQSDQLSRNDIDAILNIIQSQQRSVSSSDSGSFEVTALKNSQLISLLYRALSEKRERDRRERRESKVYKYDANEIDDDIDRVLAKNQDDDESYVDKKIIRPFDLLPQINEKSPKHSKLRSKLTPSHLLEQFQDVNERSISDYSKIYIIMNPDAVKTSQNKKKLASLLSRLLASSSASQNAEDSRIGQYGFRLSQRRDLSEKGGYQRDSFEEPRPKRQRYNGGGGGGGGIGGSGRTAIPYIRNRGDIYVRDNEE